MAIGPVAVNAIAANCITNAAFNPLAGDGTSQFFPFGLSAADSKTAGDVWSTLLGTFNLTPQQGAIVVGAVAASPTRPWNPLMTNAQKIQTVSLLLDKMKLAQGAKNAGDGSTQNASTTLLVWADGRGVATGDLCAWLVANVA